ncbi:MAG: pre-mycofactocin synthase MftD [Acidimicrobiales bacterium]
MANPWFETVAIAQQRAKRRLPASVYGAIIAGTERGLTARDNTAAFDELAFLPHVADLPQRRELATTVLGEQIALPVVLSPTGVQAVHPAGEVAVARAAAARGTAVALSCFGSKPVEEVAAANSKVFFQTYWSGTREEMVDRLARAKTAGARCLIATVDWSFSHGRDWGSPVIPEKLDLATIARFAPHALARPRWLMSYLRTGHLPNLKVPNMARADGTVPSFFSAYREWMATPKPTWEDISWLRAQWEGPFLLKGVARMDDAKRAVDAGVSAISVSNHGGNNLDGTPAAIRLLPTIAAAVGSDVEVLLDGGVRRGSDVVKALALGARAVMIGRAYLWGLAANGQAGVENVLDILSSGMDSTLLGLGRASVHELTRSDVAVAVDFTRF